MDYGGKDFSAQRAFIAAKIAATEKAAAATDAALISAQDDFHEIFRNYFSVDVVAPSAKRQRVTRLQLIAASRALGSWWRCGDDDSEFLIGFNDRLVVAAADLAICRRLAPPTDEAPTPIDRSIAAAFARRLGLVGVEKGDQPAIPALKTSGRDLEAGLSQSDPERWILYSFYGQFPRVGGDFVAMIARPDRQSETSPITGRSPLNAGNFAKVRGIPATAHFIGGSFAAPLSRILALKPGDVMPIDWQGDGGALMILGARQFATGTLGDDNGRRAIRLQNIAHVR